MQVKAAWQWIASGCHRYTLGESSFKSIALSCSWSEKPSRCEILFSCPWCLTWNLQTYLGWNSWCIQLYALHFVQVVLICLPLLLYITCFVLGVMFLRWLARASLVNNNNKNYYYHHLLLSEKSLILLCFVTGLCEQQYLSMFPHSVFCCYQTIFVVVLFSRDGHDKYILC